MADSNVIVGLDIGTTKILCLVAEVRAPGDVEIIGVSSYPSKGLQRGIVLNIDSISIIRCLTQKLYYFFNIRRKHYSG